MSPSETVAAALIAIGCFFFLAGTVGLLRFPDVYTRLHALTKADNIGLGFVAAGIMVLSGSLFPALKLLLVWLFLLYTGSLASFLVANAAYRNGKSESEKKEDA
jgi:multicomponent Na+:H+ antiporter subunit G